MSFSGCDAAKFLVTASKPGLVQWLLQACAASHNTNFCTLTCAVMGR